MTMGNSTQGNIIQFHREVRTICRIRGRRQSFYMCLMSRSSCRCWVCLALEASNSVLLFSVQGFFFVADSANIYHSTVSPIAAPQSWSFVNFLLCCSTKRMIILERCHCAKKSRAGVIFSFFYNPFREDAARGGLKQAV